MNKIIYKYNEVYQSPYDCDIQYTHKDITVYFSSTNNLKRFKIKLKEIKERMKRWKNAYSLNDIDLTLVEMLKAYEDVEKKGFRITVLNNGKLVSYKCRSEMVMKIAIENKS